MSLHLDLGIINKRIDSTGVAGFWKGTMLSNVLLKAPTSVINPTFIIDAGVEGTAEHSMYKDWPKYNYCYCSEFGRYYWIMDTKSISNRIVEIICHVDVLASFKDLIGNLKDIFIKYTSKKALADFLLDDDRLTPQKVTSARVTNIEFKDCDKEDKPNIISTGAGTYIVKTKIVAPKYNFGCVYAMDTTNFQKFCKGLRFVAPIPNAGECLAKAGGIGNISDYIEEVFWVPIRYKTIQLHGEHMSDEHMIIGPFVLQEYINASENDWLAKLFDVESTDWQSMSLDYTVFADVDTNIIRSHKVIDIDYTYPIPKVGATEYGTDEKVSLSFLRGIKYTGLFLYHPCGVINLSDDALIGSVPSTGEGAKGGKLSINFMICPLTGTYSIRCYDYETHKFLGQGTGQIKIDMSGATFGQGGWKTAQTKALFGAVSGVAGVPQVRVTLNSLSLALSAIACASICLLASASAAFNLSERAASSPNWSLTCPLITEVKYCIISSASAMVSFLSWSSLSILFLIVLKFVSIPPSHLALT